MTRVENKEALINRVSHHKIWISALHGVYRPDSSAGNLRLDHWKWANASVNWRIYDTFSPARNFRYCAVYAIETKFSLN